MSDERRTIPDDLSIPPFLSRNGAPTESDVEDLPEISQATYDALDRWAGVLDQTAKLDKRATFEAAAAALYEQAQHETDLIAFRAVEQAIFMLGRQHAGLAEDDVESVMIGALTTAEANGRINGHAALNDDEQCTAPLRNKKALVAFPLVAFENITLDTEHRGYLIKGLLPNRGLAVIWGPPKCGKSFWATDLGLHIALGWEYRGRRVQQAPVVYIALEGRHGLPARLEAFKQYHDVQSAPFYLFTTPLDLAGKADALIVSIEAQLCDGPKPGAIMIDTLNRSLVGSESKDEDMARYLAAAGKIEEKFGCLVVIVHHCGIDASRPRGHTSLSGAVEVQLAVKRGGAGEVIATVELAKDCPEGVEIFSRLEPIEVGIDPDGDKITSLVVVPTEAAVATRNLTRKLSPRQQLAIAALDECSIAAGKPAPASLQLPARTVVVRLSAWRDELYRKGVLDREAKSPREEFKRVRQQLQARGLIGLRDEMIWRA